MIIGIGGVSMAGKSTLAFQLKKKLLPKKVIIFCQDDFVRPQNEIPKINGKTDWERPESINFDNYIAHLIVASQNYNIVIAEGLFAFHDLVLNNLYDKRLFLSINENLFFKRKGIDDRWGIEPDWYMQNIWNSYLKYGQPNLNETDIISINAAKSIDMDNLLAYLYK